MRLRKPTVRVLFVAASLAVFILLLASDFRHIQITDFSEMPPGGERVKVSCVVIDCGESQKGWVLTLSDCNGGEARGFLSKEVSPEPPATGTVVELTGEVSDDDQSFIFIEMLRVLTPLQSAPASNGKS